MILNVKEDEIFMREGEIYPHMYKILSGFAEVYLGYGTERETIVRILKKGDFFGETGILTGSASIYTVVMHSDALLLEISREDLAEYIKEHPQDIIRIMKNQAESLNVFRKNMELLMNDLEVMVSERAKEGELEEFKERVKSRGTAEEFTKQLLRGKDLKAYFTGEYDSRI